jgi:hypothetical protein
MNVFPIRKGYGEQDEMCMMLNTLRYGMYTLKRVAKEDPPRLGNILHMLIYL